MSLCPLFLVSIWLYPAIWRFIHSWEQSHGCVLWYSKKNPIFLLTIWIQLCNCMSNTTLLFWFFWGTTPLTAHTQSAFSCCYLPPRFHWENALWIHSLIRLSSFMKLSYLQCSVWMHTSSDKVLTQTQLSVWLLAWWNLMESHLLHFHNIRHKSNRDNFSRAHVPVLLNIPKGKELVFTFLLCSILFDIKIQVQIFRSF